jgi:hypothetical protein
MKPQLGEQPDSTAHSGLCAASISRRDFLKGAGVAVATPVGVLGQTRAAPAHADGTPEQIHLTFGDDPSRTVFVSWASPAQAIHPCFAGFSIRRDLHSASP